MELLFHIKNQKIKSSSGLGVLAIETCILGEVRVISKGFFVCVCVFVLFKFKDIKIWKCYEQIK